MLNIFNSVKKHPTATHMFFFFFSGTVSLPSSSQAKMKDTVLKIQRMWPFAKMIRNLPALLPDLPDLAGSRFQISFLKTMTWRHGSCTRGVFGSNDVQCQCLFCVILWHRVLCWPSHQVSMIEPRSISRGVYDLYTKKDPESPWIHFEFHSMIFFEVSCSQIPLASGEL